MNEKKYIKMYINHFSFNLCAKKINLFVTLRKNIIPMYSMIDWLIVRSYDWKVKNLVTKRFSLESVLQIYIIISICFT